MVSKSKALFIFTAVAGLLTVWLAWAIISTSGNETSNAQNPGESATSPPLPAAEEAPAATSPPVNALQIPINYDLLRGQEPPVENEAPPLLAAPEKNPASPSENEGSALKFSASRNAPPGSAMGRLGSMLSEEKPVETVALAPLESKPTVVKNQPAEPAKKNPVATSAAPAKKAADKPGTALPSAKPKSNSPPPSQANASTKYFSVQLAAFSSVGNADKLKNEIEKAGAQAFITQAKVDGRLWHRVMSGRFRSRAEAVAHETSLVKKNLLKAGEQNRIKTIESAS